MTFLLVVYLFMGDGTAVIDRYPSAATTFKECMELGRTKAKALWDEYKKDGTTAHMCIQEETEE
jgi:hypothetical protein